MWLIVHDSKCECNYKNQTLKNKSFPLCHKKLWKKNASQKNIKHPIKESFSQLQVTLFLHLHRLSVSMWYASLCFGVGIKTKTRMKTGKNSRFEMCCKEELNGGILIFIWGIWIQKVKHFPVTSRIKILLSRCQLIFSGQLSVMVVNPVRITNTLTGSL